jgi:ABC-type nitrate/sulfonate/bicarbonate transport system substrate-binding protein
MNFCPLRVFAVALLLGFMFSAGGIARAQTLRVPYVSLSPTAGPLWIAYEAGFFKRNNVSTELLYIPGGSTIIQAIISGDVKIANMAPP